MHIPLYFESIEVEHRLNRIYIFGNHPDNIYIRVALLSKSSDSTMLCLSFCQAVCTTSASKYPHKLFTTIFMRLRVALTFRSNVYSSFKSLAAKPLFLASLNRLGIRIHIRSSSIWICLTGKRNLLILENISMRSWVRMRFSGQGMCILSARSLQWSPW